MRPIVIAAALSLIAATATAGQRVTLADIQAPIDTCKLSWTYPVDEQQYITGFRFFVDGTPVWTKPAKARATGCEKLGITATGTYTIDMTAYNATEESDHSDPLAIDVVTKTITVTPGAVTIQITR